MTKRVFVSYSHEDERLIKSLVELLRAAEASVFLDRGDIPLGARWRDEILRAIDGCGMVWVFWCRHSSTSEEVRGEYMRGIQQGKGTLPILLDPTPVCSALADFQWHDMQRALGPHEAEVLDRMSSEDVRRIQRADRKGRGYEGEDEEESKDRGRPNYWTDGNLFRQGWEVTDSGVVRRRQVIRHPSPEDLRAAAEGLRPYLDH